MPREKFQTLTEQMFYILLCLRTECCGIDVMAQVEQMTEGRVTIGPGGRERCTICWTAFAFPA